MKKMPSSLTLFAALFLLIPYISLAENSLEAKITETISPIIKVAPGETADFGISEKQKLTITNIGRKCGTYQLMDEGKIISSGPISLYQKIISGSNRKALLVCESGTVNVIMKK